MKKLRLVLILLLGCLTAPGLHAFLPIPLSVEELNNHADLVVRATVKGQQCLRDDQGRIYTEVTLSVAETWRGQTTGTLLKVVHSGGTLGRRAETTIGQVQYQPGEEVVAFLVHNPRGEAVTVGLEQGKFHLQRANANAPLLASNPFHRGDGSVTPSGRVLGPSLSLDELKRRVTQEAR